MVARRPRQSPHWYADGARGEGVDHVRPHDRGRAGAKGNKAVALLTFGGAHIAGAADATLADLHVVVVAEDEHQRRPPCSYVNKIPNKPATATLIMHDLTATPYRGHDPSWHAQVHCIYSLRLRSQCEIGRKPRRTGLVSRAESARAMGRGAGALAQGMVGKDRGEMLF